MKNNIIILVLTGLLLFVNNDVVQAAKELGTGTDALLGGDLTDPEDDGDPEKDKKYNAKFTSNDEPGFGGGEFAFNVFDNILGPSNDKWCCGKAGIEKGEGMWITAEFDKQYALTHFTVSSANDAPERDPLVWEVQGSNDGKKFTTIYAHDDKESLWGQRFQVFRFDAGKDYKKQTVGYKFFRHITFETPSWPNGPYFQIGEIEFFGDDSFPVDPKSKLTSSWGRIKSNR